MSHLDDCIAAIASSVSQGGARGMVRLSGTGVAAILAKAFRGTQGFDVVDRRKPSSTVGVVTIDSPRLDLPCRLYYWPTSRSYTGEPLAELHTIGSPPLLEAMLETVRRSGARLARPGEFTMRAFLSGRIDLTQAEAVLGVIDARGEAELRGALEQLAGGLGGPLRRLRDELLDLLAHLEAGLDFADEAIEFISAAELRAQLHRAHALVTAVAVRLSARDLQDAVPRIVLVGPPNAGKSSLFNALAQGSRALVADVPGTTRDYLTARINLAGVECELVDTAGVDDAAADSPLGAASQRQTSLAARRADVLVLCHDATQPRPDSGMERSAGVEPKLTIWTKADLFTGAPPPAGALMTSAVTGAGLRELCAALQKLLAADERAAGSCVRATAVRCRGSLAEAAGALDRALGVVAAGAGEELVAAELRAALGALGEVVGAVYTDDLLDRIFSRFCIGK